MQTGTTFSRFTDILIRLSWAAVAFFVIFLHFLNSFCGKKKHQYENKNQNLFLCVYIVRFLFSSLRFLLYIHLFVFFFFFLKPKWFLFYAQCRKITDWRKSKLRANFSRWWNTRDHKKITPFASKGKVCRGSV